MSEIVTPQNTGDTHGPAIYVASLADYNAGRLHGTWMPADQEPDELQAATDAMLATSSEPIAEEWAIHDYDNFAGIKLEEFTSFATVAHLALGIRTYGRAFGIFATWHGHEEASYEAFEQSYAGCWESAEDYVSERVDADSLEAELAGVVPDWLRSYVRLDAAGLARDLQLNGDIYVVPDSQGQLIFERVTT